MNLRTIILRALYSADIGLFPDIEVEDIKTSDINFELLATFPSKDIELYKGIGKKGIREIASALEKENIIGQSDWLSGKTLSSKYYERVKLVTVVDKLSNLAYIRGADTFKVNLQTFRKRIFKEDIVQLYKHFLLILISNMPVGMRYPIIDIFKKHLIW